MDTCEICNQRYPANCTCPSETDCKVCNDPTSAEQCIYHDAPPPAILAVVKHQQIVDQAFTEGVKYALEYLQELYPDIDTTDIWKDYMNN
jgi:hypothetical protein